MFEVFNTQKKQQQQQHQINNEQRAARRRKRDLWTMYKSYTKSAPVLSELYNFVCFILSSFSWWSHLSTDNDFFFYFSHRLVRHHSRVCFCFHLASLVSLWCYCLYQPANSSMTFANGRNTTEIRMFICTNWLIITGSSKTIARLCVCVCRFHEWR